MGVSNSTRRRQSAANSVVSVPTIRFRRAIKGPNWQQDEELSWLLQVWRDDSFMFRVQTTVIVPQQFGSPTTSQRESVLETTYYGSSGSVLLADSNGVQLQSYKIGATFSHLFNLSQGVIERKQAKVRGEYLSEGLQPTFLVFRTQRMEFKKRHQRPAHIMDDLAGGSSARGPRKSVIIPDAHGLVQAIPVDSKGVATLPLPNPPRRESAPVLPSNYQSNNKGKGKQRQVDRLEEATTTLGPIPDLDEAFDWEWECDGIVEEDPLVIQQLSQRFPPRVVDILLGYIEPDAPTIDKAIVMPAPRSRGVSISRKFQPPDMTPDPTSGAPVSARGSIPHGPLPRSNTVFGGQAKIPNPTDAGYHATSGLLRLFAEIPAKSDAIRISHRPILIKPPVVEDAKGEKRVDPDFDVTVNFLKEPTPEPVAQPTFEIQPPETFELPKWNA